MNFEIRQNFTIGGLSSGYLVVGWSNDKEGTQGTFRHWHCDIFLSWVLVAWVFALK